MKKDTSLYLDAVRFIAAALVFIDHASSGRYTNGFLWQLAPLGGQAVMVFFVLSGFVITHVTEVKENTLRSYVLSRTSRIYSVAVPALFLTFSLDAIARHVKPELFSSVWGYEWTGRIWQFLSALFFENQVWGMNVNIGSNLPYWSLGYEVWYYVIFAIFVFYGGRQRIFLLTIAALAAGPNIMILFPIWVLGYLAYRICSKYNMRKSTGLFLLILSTFLLIFYELHVIYHGVPVLRNNYLDTPLIYQDYIIGILYFLQLIGFSYCSSYFSSFLHYLERPIRYLAGSTFSLYLFHMPLCQFISALSPWRASSWNEILLIFLGVPILAIVISHYTERKKSSWKKGLALMFGIGAKLFAIVRKS